MAWEGGQAVPQRVHGYALIDLPVFGCGVNGAVELARAQRIHRIEPREHQPQGSVLPSKAACWKRLHEYRRSLG